MKKSRIVLILIALLGLLLIQRSLSFAQSTQSGLSISPVVFELNSAAGDTVTSQIKIYNPTQFPQSVDMVIEDFTPVGEEGDVVLAEADDDSTYSLAAWATITPSQFVLRPEEQQIVTFTINVPTNAEPGGHYGSIVASLSGGTENVSGSSVGSKRGSLLLLRVAGDINEDISIDTFSVDSFQEYGPVDFELKFKNDGNVHLKPAGFITIVDTFGNQVAQVSIPQNNVIPDAIRQANTTWEEENLMGRYTATVVVTYGNSAKQTITDVVTFTVFPWKTALMYIGGLTAFSLLIYASRKRLAAAFKVLMGKNA